MSNGSPEAAPLPGQEPQPQEPVAEGEEQLIKNPDVAAVEAYAEDMHRQFMETFGQEQADEWFADQRPVLDAEIKKIEATDKASDLMVIVMTQDFMRNTTQARQSRSEMPIDVLSSKNVTALLDATKASPGYTETGVGQNTGPVVESAIDKFSQILTGKKLSTVHQAWESWRRSPKFNNAPMEGRITPSLSPGVKDETVRTNLSNVALSINPYNRSFAFVYTNKNIPGGIPTAEQFIKNCNEAAGESKPEDSTR